MLMWTVGVHNNVNRLVDDKLNIFVIRRHYFTLIEVIVVLVIFGLILGIALPKIGSVSSGIIQSNAIKNIKSSFYMASSIAAASGKPVKLKFNLEQKSIDINHAASTTVNRHIDESDAPRGSLFDDLKQFKLPESAELNPHSFHDDSDDAFEYSFYPNGEASGSGISILIEESIALSIDVDRLTGKPLIKIDEY